MKDNTQLNNLIDQFKIKINQLNYFIKEQKKIIKKLEDVTHHN